MPKLPAFLVFEYILTAIVIIALIVAVALILSLALLLLLRRRSAETKLYATEESAVGSAFAATASRDASVSNDPTGKVQFQKDDMKTMVIPTDVSGTMRFMPGKLEVIKGENAGTTFRMAGYPTNDGTSVVTIGREKNTGPGEFAHIQLKERTISRKQAELLQKDGKVSIKNLSKTNYTQVNGEEIPPEHTRELKGGEILTFGEVDIKYSLS